MPKFEQVFCGGMNRYFVEVFYLRSGGGAGKNLCEEENHIPVEEKYEVTHT